MDSLVEQIRSLHEEFDFHERQASEEFLEDFYGPRDALLHHTRVRAHLDSMSELASRLNSLYADPLLLSELDHVAGNGDLDTALQNFFTDSRSIHHWFDNHPEVLSSESAVLSRKDKFFEDSEIFPNFTGEEDFGKYVDLNHFHSIFLNLNSYFPEIDTTQVDYLAYLDLFYSFKRSDGSFVVTNRDDVYKNYVESVYNYLIDFIRRIRPLYNIEKLISELENHEYSDLISFYENSISHLAEHHLKSIIEATKGRLENRQVRTLEELVEDNQNRLINVDDLHEHIRIESKKEVQLDEEQEVIYNPKDLPLDFDGKPIPYWLFKLQGLSKKYTCEICGDIVYRGRKRFERHFNQPKHGHALKCLKIPNTKHFRGVERISDALRLYEKLKQQRNDEVFDPDEEEEVEDEEGNIMNRRTYLMIQKQFGE
ncbi:hypothetical protein P9112_007304 [Eukaryota sp. TZLM1-RC]